MTTLRERWDFEHDEGHRKTEAAKACPIWFTNLGRRRLVSFSACQAEAEGQTEMNDTELHAEIARLIAKRDAADLADKALRARTDLTKKEKRELGHEFMIDYIAAEIKIGLLVGTLH